MTSPKTVRLIVAGGRDFNNYEWLRDTLDYYLQKVDKSQVEIVCGKARGADSLGERYAKEKGFPVAEFPADWERYDMLAGPMRNAQMGDYATHCIAFWDGKSRGTGGMIKIAKVKRLKLRVVRYQMQKNT